MSQRMKALTVGLILLTASVAGCASTSAESAGAAQDDATSSASSGASATSAAAVPSTAPSTAPPPLLGEDLSVDMVCDSGLQYACGDTGPGGGIVYYASKRTFIEQDAPCDESCNYLEAQTASAGQAPWCVGPGASEYVNTYGFVGGGYSSTLAMLAACTSGAANLAVAPSGGLSDWFLPSQMELDALVGAFQFFGSSPICGSLPGEYTSAWTSTQDGRSEESAVWVSSDLNQDTQIAPSSSSYTVCPIRAF
jgi:hypothetical protein